MSNVSSKEIERADQEHLRAIKDYERLHTKYFPVGAVTPGVPTTPGEPFTDAALKELKEAKARIDETWERFISLLRASRS
jgi:hypothetical protein